MVELVDTRDLKSLGHRLCRFKPGSGYQKIRTTRIAGGLLWPCKGLLPAAPKDAGFHAVQAQCPCRLGYPLKGS